MNQKTFLRRVVSTGEVSIVPFTPVHYAEAGVPAACLHGMPILEAYQLVNKWNISQTDQRFVYGLQ